MASWQRLWEWVRPTSVIKCRMMSFESKEITLPTLCIDTTQPAATTKGSHTQREIFLTYQISHILAGMTFKLSRMWGQLIRKLYVMNWMSHHNNVQQVNFLYNTWWKLRPEITLSAPSVKLIMLLADLLYSKPSKTLPLTVTCTKHLILPSPVC